MSNWSIKTPPKYRPDAVATAKGWADPVTNEILVAIGSLLTKQGPLASWPTFTLAVPANGSYPAPTALTFTVTASAQVAVSGKPSLDVTFGSTVHANTSLAWASNVVTATVATGILGSIGSTFQTTISGVTPAGYNGTFTATVASATTFTYPLVSSPGAETVPGTFTLPGSSVRQAVYTGIDATGKILTFSYTTVAGDDAAAGISVANKVDLNTTGKGPSRIVDELVLNSGETIPGASLTFTVPATAGIITTG